MENALNVLNDILTTATIRSTACVRDDNCCKPQNVRCRGDVTFEAFQPMGNVPFLEKRGIHFFSKDVYSPSIFSRSSPAIPTVSQFYPYVQRSNKHTRKQRAVKPRPNDQRNIVGRNMLRAFGHPVLMCCNKLGVVGSLKLEGPAKRS